MTPRKEEKMIEVKKIHIVVPKELFFKLRDGGFLDIVDEMATIGLYKEITRREELTNELVLKKCNNCGNKEAQKKENTQKWKKLKYKVE